jgi:hypothetical protein
MPAGKGRGASQAAAAGALEVVPKSPKAERRIAEYLDATEVGAGRCWSAPALWADSALALWSGGGAWALTLAFGCPPWKGWRRRVCPLRGRPAQSASVAGARSEARAWRRLPPRALPTRRSLALLLGLGQRLTAGRGQTA